MKRFFITLLLAGVGASTAATAQSSRTYEDDIYTSGSQARGEDEVRRSSSQSNQSTYPSSSQQQRSYNDDGYASNDGYGDDGYSSYNRSYDNDYVDYDDDDYYYATRLNRFNQPFYNRGYWSAFNNPFWYDPFWYDPYWGYNPWYRPGITVSIGGGWGGYGGPYWNSYWGYNTWYGYGGFNSCWGYPVYAGGWGGGYWNGFNQGYYNGYWNGYYAGLYNGGGYGYGNGNGWGYGNSGWRNTSYGPRNTMNSGMRPGARTAYNGGVSGNSNAGVILGPRNGRKGTMEVGNAAQPNAVRDRAAFSGGEAVRTPRTAGAAVNPGTVPDRAAAAPSRYQVAADRDDRLGSSPDRIRTDRAPRSTASEDRATPRFNSAPDRGAVDAAAPSRTPRSFGADRNTAEAPRSRFNNAPAYEAPRNRSFGQSDNSFGSRPERSNNAPRYEAAPRQQSRSFEQPAPRMERQRSFESAPRMESTPRMSAPQRSDFGGSRPSFNSGGSSRPSFNGGGGGGGSRGGSFGGGRR